MNSILFRLISIFMLVTTLLVNASSQCTSEAGAMSTFLIETCGDETAIAQASIGSSLDADDLLQYFLHTASGTALGTVISTNTDPSFSFNGSSMSYGTTYYISAVVGNDDGTGNVDLNDPCLSVAAGTPVSWNESPNLFLSGSTVICEGETAILNISMTGSFPITFTLNENGTPSTYIATSSPFTIPVTPNITTNYDLIDAFDANGCPAIVGGQALVEIYQFPSCNFIGIPMTCNILGSIFVDCPGSQEPLFYTWSNGMIGPILQNLSPGAYAVTITSQFGCTTTNVVIVPGIPPIQCASSISGPINCTNSEATITMTCSSANVPLTYQWSGPNNFTSTTANPIVTEPGVYTVIVTETTGCTYTETITVIGEYQDCGNIIGTVTSEEDGNCSLDSGENGLANWMVRATATNGNEYFDFTDSLGHYALQAPIGDYTVETLPPAAYWTDCGTPISLTLEDITDEDTADFHLLQIINCPLMEVDISTPLLRRCFSGNYYVNYCNNGSETAVGAHITVELDPLISIQSASLPYTEPASGTYDFEIGDVEPGDCGNFYFTVQVSCDAVLGQTLCAEAHVYPDSICVPIDPTWSGAFIEITSTCTADSVIFTITNTGTGDMTETQGFIVVQDGVMLLTNDVQLQSGASTTISFPANGDTYNLVVDQVSGVPGNSNPALFVEACGTDNAGSFSIGFASQFPEDDAEPFVSIDCHEVIGSFDPNDKRGFPLGYGNDHLIEQGQTLDYHIRFQNTGTDTAFNVVVVDVIDPSLDIATLRPGSSSHPYQLDINQDTLVFTFENILLPDSNVNESGSHGFVKFNIGQKAGLDLGTVIENEAAIYFDFNDPVITNKTAHKLGEHFFPSAAQPPVLPKKITCLVYPNPMGDEAVVLVQGTENQAVELWLYNLTGQFLRSEKITGGVGKIRKNGLSEGLYFYQILANGLMIGQGKLVME